MGPRTFEDCRDKWIAAGFYPSISAGSSTASTTSTVSELKLRAYDWWASKHKLDKKTGKYVIEDQETKKTADALVITMSKRTLLIFMVWILKSQLITRYEVALI